MDICKRLRIEIGLDHGVAVDPIDLTVGALSDHLAAFNGDNAVRLLDVHHLGKARHIEDLIYVGRHIDKLGIRHSLFHAQNDAKACAGDVGKPLTIQDDAFGRFLGANIAKLTLYRRGVGRINMSFQPNSQGILLQLVFHISLLLQKFVPHRL